MPRSSRQLLESGIQEVAYGLMSSSPLHCCDKTPYIINGKLEKTVFNSPSDFQELELMRAE